MNSDDFRGYPKDFAPGFVLENFHPGPEIRRFNFRNQTDGNAGFELFAHLGILASCMLEE
ncbi:MAG: hypothetical protein R2875_08410 [Desulfobacterales bacterium]